MKSIDEVLRRIDGRGYKAYKKLYGVKTAYMGVKLELIRIQSDPYAPPSVAEVTTKIPERLLEYAKWRIPLADFLLRRIYAELNKRSRKVGEGRSGYLGVPKPSNIMLWRSSCEIIGGNVVFRVWVGLPSRRRRVLGDEAISILTKAIPDAVRRVLRSAEENFELVKKHVLTWRMQEYIRSNLRSKRLVSFIKNGSILPRRCGWCEEPLENAVPFESPKSLEVEFQLPWGEVVYGMGIRRGVTVIAGAAFHGKTTLAQAIAWGVWNHIPGDGREGVVTIREAMHIETEEGRFVSCVDTSPFIRNLPFKGRVKELSTEAASGATSVAASIQEAVEAGAELLILDEDLVATNILYTDERASSISREQTINPIYKLAPSIAKAGLSLIIVSSGSLPLLAAADTVIVMENYKPIDKTREARELALKHNVHAGGVEYRVPKPRLLVKPPKVVKPRVKGRVIEDKRGGFSIDLKSNICVREETQLNTLALLLKRAGSYKNMCFREIADLVNELFTKNPLRELGVEKPPPNLGFVRGLDFIYVLNRIPSMKASFKEGA